MISARWTYDLGEVCSRRRALWGGGQVLFETLSDYADAHRKPARQSRSSNGGGADESAAPAEDASPAAASAQARAADPAAAEAEKSASPPRPATHKRSQYTAGTLT